MKKKYTRKSNPVNNTGYTPGYSTENNPFNIIPSENITMRNTPYPVQGTPLDQNGYPMGDSIAMQPGQDYKFGGASFVLETPNFAKGGTKQNWISDKIGKLMREGYPQKQAVAIAYSMYNQNHGNGGYQLPMYQFAGTAELDAFGQPIPNEQATATVAPTGNLNSNGNFAGSLTYGKATEDPNKQTSEQKSFAPGNANSWDIDNNGVPDTVQKPEGNPLVKSKPDKDLKQEEEDESKKAREDAEESGITQFYNPYGGYDMGQSLFNAGKSLKEGNTLGLVANSANVLFEGAKGFLGGMGSANVQQQQKQDYYQKQREGMTGQNRATPLGKRGGRFATFKLGGYQLPMYQEAGLYLGEEEGSYGQNESMDRGVNSEKQRRAILLRAEPGSVTAEEAPKDYVEPAKEQAPAFDSSSARDMWVHKTGMPWSKAKELGYTTGSAQDNTKLLAELKDERFRKENLRSTAPKRKTANRKAIDLKTKAAPEPAYDQNVYDSIATQGSQYFGSPRWRGLMNTAGVTGGGLDLLGEKDKREFLAAQEVANRMNERGQVEDYFSGKTSGGRGGLQAISDSYARGTLSPKDRMAHEDWLNKAESVNEYNARVKGMRANLKKAQPQIATQGRGQGFNGEFAKAMTTPYSSRSLNYELGGYYQEGGMQFPGEEQMGGEMPNPQEGQGEVPQQEQMQQMMQQISEALQQGADPQQILQQLMQMGIPQQQAQQMVEMAMQELQGGQQQAPQGTPQLRYGGRMYQEGGEAMDEEMEGEDEGAEGESPSMEQIEDQVEQALKQGADPQQILEQLIQMGMPEQQAVQMIQEILQEIQGGETEMEAPEQGNPQMRAGGKYLEILKGKTIKSYSLNKKTGNYEVQYS